MTVKTYGANANLALDGTGISGTDIAEEYGGNDQTNVKMSDYYAGGSLVPAGTNGYPTGGSAVAIPSSGQISMNNFFASTGVLSHPAGTYTGRTGTAGTQSATHVVYMRNHSSAAIAYSIASVAIRLVGSTGVVEIQIKRLINHQIKYWYNTSDVASVLGTGWQTIWQMNHLPDSVKWTLNNATNNSGDSFNFHQEQSLSGVTSQLSTSYQTINTSTTLGRTLQSSALSECYADGDALRYWGVLFDFRTSGYSDAEGHAEFVFKTEASALSTQCL